MKVRSPSSSTLRKRSSSFSSLSGRAKTSEMPATNATHPVTRARTPALLTAASTAAVTSAGNRRFMRKSLFPHRPAASRKSAQSRVRNAAEMGSRSLALARLETAVRLVDDIDAAFAAHDAIIAMAAAQGFQRITDFHGAIPRKGQLIRVGPSACQCRRACDCRLNMGSNPNE